MPNGWKAYKRLIGAQHSMKSVSYDISCFAKAFRCFANLKSFRLCTWWWENSANNFLTKAYKDEETHAWSVSHPLASDTLEADAYTKLITLISSSSFLKLERLTVQAATLLLFESPPTAQISILGYIRTFVIFELKLTNKVTSAKVLNIPDYRKRSEKCLRLQRILST